MIRAQEPGVLIVGGSLVGLSTAMLLRLHGVSCLVVERHTGTAIHAAASERAVRDVLEHLRCRSAALSPAIE
jgi:2-polyprenyl-6-methoxyphenol hydroxylase-like FAD-dependent oxidoreductase